jgi:hypothetical protein
MLCERHLGPASSVQHRTTPPLWTPAACEAVCQRAACLGGPRGHLAAACRGRAPAAVLDCVSWRQAEIDGHPAMILPTTAGTWQMRGAPRWREHHPSRANEQRGGACEMGLATLEACVPMASIVVAASSRCDAEQDHAVSSLVVVVSAPWCRGGGASRLAL